MALLVLNKKMSCESLGCFETLSDSFSHRLGPACAK